MTKAIKMGDINYNTKLECYFCKKLIPAGSPFFSAISQAEWNPSQHETACEKCAYEYK